VYTHIHQRQNLDLWTMPIKHVEVESGYQWLSYHRRSRSRRRGPVGVDVVD